MNDVTKLEECNAGISMRQQIKEMFLYLLSFLIVPISRKSLRILGILTSTRMMTIYMLIIIFELWFRR